MLYRLLTEDKNQPQVLKLISEYFPSFTVGNATGYWEGTKEPSLVIELYTSTPCPEAIRSLIKAIKVLNNQEAVLLQTIACQGEFV